MHKKLMALAAALLSANALAAQPAALAAAHKLYRPIARNAMARNWKAQPAPI